MATASYRVVSGPSKFDFATRYFDGALQMVMPFVFTIEDDQREKWRGNVSVCLSKIEHRSFYAIPCHDWVIGGLITDVNTLNGKKRRGEMSVPQRFTASYNTQTRDGVLQLLV